MKYIELLYGVMLVLALVCIYFAFKHYYKTQNLLQNGIKTNAEVIDLIKISGDDGYSYKPVFEYLDRNKHAITFESGVSTRPATYDVGDIVTIVYSENSVDQKVLSFWGLYRWTVILLSIASPLLIISIGYFMYSRG